MVNGSLGSSLIRDEKRRKKKTYFKGAERTRRRGTWKWLSPVYGLHNWVHREITARTGEITRGGRDAPAFVGGSGICELVERIFFFFFFWRLF